MNRAASLGPSLSRYREGDALRRGEPRGAVAPVALAREFATRAMKRTGRFVLGSGIFVVAISLTGVPARAVMPDEISPNPQLEARARSISAELRCLVCQNQNIDDSNAPLARDLRILLRERLTAGDSDRQAVDYIVARFGNFVLLRPPVQTDTLLLWTGPALFLSIAGFAFVRYVRNRSSCQSDEAAPLSPPEQKRLDALLAKKGFQ